MKSDLKILLAVSSICGTVAKHMTVCKENLISGTCIPQVIVSMGTRS